MLDQRAAFNPSLANPLALLILVLFCAGLALVLFVVWCGGFVLAARKASTVC
jgi:hypothetical protein